MKPTNTTEAQDQGLFEASDVSIANQLEGSDTSNGMADSTADAGNANRSDAALNAYDLGALETDGTVIRDDLDGMLNAPDAASMRTAADATAVEVEEGFDATLPRQTDARTLDAAMPDAQLTDAAELEDDAFINAADRGTALRTWTTADIYAALVPECVLCHSAGTSSPYFESLDAFVSGIVSNRRYVIPGAPDSSEFIALLDGRSALIFSQMPPVGDPYTVRTMNREDAPTVNDLEAWVLGLSAQQLPDAALPDAALPDAASPQTTVLDAGVPDAQMPDAQMPRSDASTHDAQSPDGNLPDAQLLDAASNLTDAVVDTPDSDVATREWTTAEIYTALVPTCVACHGAGTSSPYFESLDAFVAGIVNNDRYVIPGEPANSEFIALLNGQSVLSFSQMPPNGYPYFIRTADEDDAPSIADLEAWVLSLLVELTPDAEMPDAETIDAQMPDADVLAADAQIPDLEGQDMAIPDSGVQDAALPTPDAEVAIRSWTTQEIYEALAPICADCHGEGQSSPFFASYNEFVSGIVSDTRYVKLGRSNDSELIALLRGDSTLIFAQMPPGGDSYAVLTADDVTTPTLLELAYWIDSLTEIPEVDSTTVCRDFPAPKLLHRLNRLEYNRSVAALVGTTSTPANDFPSEDLNFGFDNVAQALTVSPLLIEKYDLAAQSLAAEALPDPRLGYTEYTFEAESQMEATLGAAQGGGWNLWSRGNLTAEVTLNVAGKYRFRANVRGGQAGPDPIQMAFLINEQAVATINVYSSEYEEVSIDNLELPAGEHNIGVRFLNDYWCPQEKFDNDECGDGDPSMMGDRNLYVDWVSLDGPTDRV